MKNLLGIYEKALPGGIDWLTRLELAKNSGFDFIEISIDETEERMSRLYSSKEEMDHLVDAIQKTGIPILTMCFSGHRKYPLGSHSADIRNKSMELMTRAIDFAVTAGIRIVQLAGYDVYYEESDDETKEHFITGLKQSVKLAARSGVMLSVEIMDTPFINSIIKYMEYDEVLNSPWFTVYPDLGNLTAWGNDVETELERGIHRIAAVHVKDTLAVTANYPGKFKDVPFGNGCVDFIKCFKKLKELDYSGPFLIEMWSEKAENPMREVLNAKKWVEERLRESGF